ncbi:MAG TPA: hypothetical protein VKA15_26560 [Isosphaeraceae bacterium]|nr:hypothetical protein [Isosphaeraceae bacterium]
MIWIWVAIDNARRTTIGFHASAFSYSLEGSRPPMDATTRSIRLGDLAHTRSGDKGDRSNIGVVANDSASYAWLAAHLTDEVVAAYLRPMGIGKVRRYDLSGLHAFNFVIDHALAGGASRSLRFDTQGKALGVVLLELQIPAPSNEPLPTEEVSAS